MTQPMHAHSILTGQTPSAHFKEAIFNTAVLVLNSNRSPGKNLLLEYSAIAHHGDLVKRCGAYLEQSNETVS